MPITLSEPHLLRHWSASIPSERRSDLWNCGWIERFRCRKPLKRRWQDSSRFRIRSPPRHFHFLRCSCRFRQTTNSTPKDATMVVKGFDPVVILSGIQPLLAAGKSRYSSMGSRYRGNESSVNFTDLATVLGGIVLLGILAWIA